MGFANEKLAAPPHPFWKIGEDLHQEIAGQSMRPAQFANHQKDRLARQGRACFIRWCCRGDDPA